MKGILEIKNLFASVEGKPILNGVSFTVTPGKVHVIMGPNGSGKSTLAHVLMGDPAYECKRQKSKCKIKIGNKDLLDLPTEERAKEGLFLAFQSPISIPGVTVVNLLRSAYSEMNAIPNGKKYLHNPGLTRARGTDFTVFTKTLKQYAKLLHIDESFLERGIGDGFSGGEKKKMEMLQALVIDPKYAIFDEIDTGLDVDALKTVASGITILKKQGTGVIIITHYQRILKYIRPDIVHVLIGGKIIQTGTASLAREIEQNGYGKYLKNQNPNV